MISGAAVVVARAPATTPEGVAHPWQRPCTWRIRLLMLGALVTVLVPIAASRAAYAVLPAGADQGLYVTIGEVIERGGVPWRDAWDNKPPGTYYLYAGVLALAPDYSRVCIFNGGPIPPDGLRLPCAQIALSVVDALYALATAIVVGWLAARLFGPLAGYLAALLFAVYGSMTQVLNGGANPDVHALLPTTLAYAAALRYADSGRRGWLFAAGVLVGLAALFKQPGILALPAIALWHVFATQPRRSALPGLCLLSAGVALVLGVTAAVFGALGALPDLVEQSVLWYRYYLGAPATDRGVLYLAVTQTLKVFLQSQSGLWIAALGALPLALEQRRDHRVWLMAAWLTASVGSIAAGGAHFHQYYYVALVPVCAVAAGWAVGHLWTLARPLYRLWIAGAALALVVLSSQLQGSVLLRAWNNRVTSTSWTAEEYVGGATRDGESIFVWGNESQVYALSGARPASRYLHTVAVSDDFARSDGSTANRRDLLAGLERQPPSYIVLDRPWLEERQTVDFPELQALIARAYVLANDPTQDHYRGWEIYRRVDTG